MPEKRDVLAPHDDVNVRWPRDPFEPLRVSPQLPPKDTHTTEKDDFARLAYHSDIDGVEKSSEEFPNYRMVQIDVCEETVSYDGARAAASCPRCHPYPPGGREGDGRPLLKFLWRKKTLPFVQPQRLPPVSWERGGRGILVLPGSSPPKCR